MVSHRAAFLAFDYILTFDDEVMLFWRGHQRSGATVLFLLNRYITLASQIVNTVPIPSEFSDYVAAIVLRALQYLPWAAFSALRSYALCPEPFRLLVPATVFALSSVPIVTNMWGALHGLSVVDDPNLGVIPVTPISASTAMKLAVATRCALIGSDLLVLCFTCYRTYETAKLSLRSLGKKTFAGILLLDGAYSNLSSKPDALLILSVLQMTLTAILTSRFLIDLQKAQRKLAGSSQSISLGEVAFRPQTSTNMSRFVGSLGAQLSFHEDDEQDQGGDEP
ncbi:hypothetical protein BD310DRAFT_831499 [Dichomitus squalens]|uniref:DUF6533 domain-containing protein n=1 Tax=Dichomitus squalens TaxID=114155 RepID=A0A4Q9PD49_9APHY|nr:hypothetical protein BD310DRAFT_831499 [Dichomitus squalens]